MILEFESERQSMIERALEHHHKELKKLELEPDIVKGNDLIKRDLQKNIEVIKQVMQQTGMPGFAIAVVENQNIVYSAGFGVKNLNSKQQMSASALFHMASITKPFVATSIMQLWEQGKIDLDAPVVTYLPYFRLADDRYKQITVRQMLSHISGMPDVQDYEWNKPQYDDGALERYVRSSAPNNS